MTGAAHWHTLLKARAIENQCYMIGCNQGGMHSAIRETYGHSAIIDAWGRVLAETAQGIDIVMSDCDLDALKKIREQMPVLAHRRF